MNGYRELFARFRVLGFAGAFGPVLDAWGDAIGRPTNLSDPTRPSSNPSTGRTSSSDSRPGIERPTSSTTPSGNRPSGGRPTSSSPQGYSRPSAPSSSRYQRPENTSNKGCGMVAGSVIATIVATGLMALVAGICAVALG